MPVPPASSAITTSTSRPPSVGPAPLWVPAQLRAVATAPPPAGHDLRHLLWHPQAPRISQRRQPCFPLGIGDRQQPISFIKAWQAIRARRALMVFGSQLGRWGRVGGCQIGCLQKYKQLIPCIWGHMPLDISISVKHFCSSISKNKFHVG